MQIPQQVPQAFGTTLAANNTLTFLLPNIRSRIPPQYLAVFDQFVAACQRVMYDPRTHGLMQKELAKNVPMAQKLAEGVCGLVLILYQDQRGRVPSAILIPAAVDLIGEAARFVVQETRQPIAKAVYSQAVTLAIAILSKKLGITRQLAQRAQPRQPAGGLRAQQMAPGA